MPKQMNQNRPTFRTNCYKILEQKRYGKCAKSFQREKNRSPTVIIQNQFQKTFLCFLIHSCTLKQKKDLLYSTKWPVELMK